MRRGELIRLDDPEYTVIEELITRAFRITGELNAGYHDAAETVSYTHLDVYKRQM